MRTVLTLFPGWLKVARSNLSNLRPHPDPANHTKFVRGDGTLAPPSGAGVSYNASTNNSGNTTVTPTESLHTEQMTFGGSGSTTRIVIISTSGVITAGSRLFLRGLLPSTADIRIEFRNGAADGTLEHHLITDGTGDDVSLDFYSNGSAWKFDRMTYPANAATT